MIPLPEIGNGRGGVGFGGGGGEDKLWAFKFEMPVGHPGKDT